MVEYQTFKQMRDQVSRFIQDTSARRETMLNEEINSVYDMIASQYLWPSLVKTKTISTVSGSRYVYLPKDCRTLLFLFDATNKQVAPHELLQNLYYRAGQTIDTAGMVSEYSDVGEVGRKVDFHTSAETISVVSSSAVDTANLLLKGIDATGDNEITESVTLNGTTPVVTTATFTDIISVGLAGTHAGTITISGTDSTITYATVAPGDTTARYKALQLHFVPSNVFSLIIGYKKRVKKLTEDQDVPEIPVSAVIVEWCKAQQFARDRKTMQFQMHMQMAKDYLNAKLSEQQQGDRIEQAIPFFGGPRGDRGRDIVVVSG